MGLKINLKLTMYKDDVLHVFMLLSLVFYLYLGYAYLVLEILIFRHIYFILPVSFACQLFV